MLDGINLERKGIPAAVIGVDNLLRTTGIGMARTHGFADMHFVSLPYSVTDWGGQAGEDQLKEKAAIAAPQVEAVLIAASRPKRTVAP